MIYLRRLYWPLLSLLLFAAGCTEIPGEQHSGLINGYYGCPKSDMTVTDMGVVDIATLYPDLWFPTCKYDWIPQSRPEYVYTPFTSLPSRTPYTGKPYILYPDPGLYPSLPYTYLLMRAWPDPYNPAFTSCLGCDTNPYAAAVPRMKFSIDIKAVNMPNVKAGDLDVWIQITQLVGTSREWWSPQTTPSERKLMPGHYNFDFTVPFNVYGPYIRLVVQNFDSMDSGGYIESTITSDSMKTTQPCAGFLPLSFYPIKSSIP